MLLVGYLYGIKSERRLVQEVQLNIAYRWFCGFELADKIPDHSTFSKTRLRKWNESQLFRVVGVAQNCFHHHIASPSFKIQNRISVLSQKQSADNQVERLICDQFGGCEIGKSDIAAAGGDGFGRLINTVQFRLDTGKLDGLEVKSAGIKLPDHPAPGILIRREEKQRSQITA